MSLAQMTAEQQNQSGAAHRALVEKLLELPKVDLARALAAFPPHMIEAALQGDGEGAAALEAHPAAPGSDGLVARAERRRTFQSAKAVFNNRMSVADCTIRNRSDRGFLVEAKNALSIPQSFELHLPMSDDRFVVRVVWRNGGQMGVAIDD